MLYKGSGILLIHKSKNKTKVFLGKRIYNPHRGSWSIPGGASNRGEKSYETAKREFFEEIGIRREKGISFKYINKHEINLFVFKFTIYIFSTNKIPKIMYVKKPFEFSKVGWFDINKLPKNLHFGVRESIEKINA